MVTDLESPPGPSGAPAELSETSPRTFAAREHARHAARRRVDLARAQTVARWTDARFLDPIVGLLLPGAGDVLGAAAGLYIVMIAVRHRAPRATVARMVVNLAVDCLGGVVPVVGDLFDLVNRANMRNAGLLQQHLADAAPSVGGRSQGLVAPVALLVAAVAAALAVAYAVFKHGWWR